MVDASPRDYAKLLESSAAKMWCFRFLQTGTDALRSAAIDAKGLWMVNIELPDFSGVDLCDMLRSRTPAATVCLIGDEYREDEERLAYQAGATAYACKPLDGTWLQHWHDTT